MTAATFRNALTYVAVSILPPVADGVYQYLQVHSGEAINWQQVGLVALMAAMGAIVAANRPRVGHEEIAAQVDTLKRRGVKKRGMTVLSDDEAVEALGGASTIGRGP
jgi:hypothetical protein